ncbi:MAG: hypothetical protein ATN35_04525 [Epulopiscium sp. Nele67-Bin004]|nr:MAG: hypothetical protein ATN35_04525 [Epulopiscium sp. Nele67-Bin004]
MNKKFLLTCACFLFGSTVFANDTQLSISGVSYEPVAQMYNNEVANYISIEDFANITMGEYSSASNGKYQVETLTDSITFTTGANFLTSNKTRVVFSNPVLLIDDMLYIPIDVFEALELGIQQNDIIDISLSIPTTHILDTLDSKLFTQLPSTNSFNNLPTYIDGLVSNETIEETKKLAQSGDYYFSFVDNTNKQDIYNELNTKINRSSYGNIEIIYREFANDSISSTITETVDIDIQDDSLHFSIGEHEFEYSNILATFAPSIDEKNISIEKTIDVTLMHAFYTFYRNTYRLKDDEYFSPIYLTESGNVNSFSQHVYTIDDATGEIMDYTITVHRLRNVNNLQFIIDITQL